MDNETYDVAVVGTGVAGLSAAVAAAEAGARVIVIERAPKGEYGGNTRYTEAFLRMKSVSEVADDFADHFQANAGYHVDPSLAAKTLAPESDQPGIVKTLNMVDPEIIETLESSAGPTLEWLRGFGVTFTPIESPFLVKATTRWAPSGGGLQLIESLMHQLVDRGATLLFETTAQSLIIDPSTGAVAGVRCRRNGQVQVVLAPSVVLACGGFEGNPEMLSRYIPNANFTRPVARGGTFLTCSRCMGTGKYKGFKLAYVFDISQTEGEEIPGQGRRLRGHPRGAGDRERLLRLRPQGDRRPPGCGTAPGSEGPRPRAGARPAPWG